MKKILVIFSLVSFVAVTVSVAQTTEAKKDTKKEVVTKENEKPASHACCKGGSMKNCTAEQMKNCTPAEKAACAKGEKDKACTHGEKSKADAGTEKKDGTKSDNN